MSLQSTVKAIESAGFGYLKVELEAQLDRPDEYDRNWETCSDCEGSGNENCDNCEGEGHLVSHIHTSSGRDTGETEEIECQDCWGEGTQECNNCDGEGQVEGEGLYLGSESDCEEFIKEHISNEAKESLIFDRFYNDGSVDSEYTFTIPVEKAHVLPEFIRAFGALGREVGNGIDVEGAGMHIAVITKASGGKYPVPNDAGMDNVGLQNFRNEVTKLLPALFVAACSGNFTRTLEYRHPRIDEDKYSAIHVMHGCLEYRLFETCYDRPEAIFEFLGTIARTLEFYKDANKRVSAMGKQFNFYEEDNLECLTSTPEQIRIIKKQINLVAPKGMTLKQFYANRSINLSVTEANKKHSSKVSKAKAMFREQVRHYSDSLKRPLSATEEAHLRDMERNGYFNPSTTDEQKIAQVRGLRKPENEQQFIENNLSGLYVEASVMV